ncbi:MAG: PQQ-binding-like beta-propeller repeat protein [Planctomycetales bacterium]|nr:PQQ-binding-like beta-propeller repeat protein [Planctomycetales bacterium]
MTDEQLIELVQRKAPEDLSLAEIEQLRERLRGSSALQQALTEELHLEQYLSRALARVDVPVDELLDQVCIMRSSVSRWWTAAGFACGLVLAIALVAGVVYWNRASRQIAKRVQLPNPPGRADVAPSNQDADASKAVRPADPPTPQPAEQPPEPTEQPASEEKPPAAADANAPAQESVPAPAAQVVARGPWDAEDQLAGAPVSVVDAAIRLRPHEQHHLAQSILEKWFESADGKRLAFKDEWRTCAMEGVARLKAPWPQQALLRWVGAGYDHFAIHVWHGREGVSLRYYGDRGSSMSWAAYRVERTGKEPTPVPDKFALLETDSGRFWRTKYDSNSPLDLRYEDGLLILARGAFVLLEVPLAGAPEEVIFDGKTRLADIAMFRAEPLPRRESREPSVVLDGSQPDQLAWLQSVDQEGGKQADTGEPVYPVWKACALPAAGPVAIDLVLSSAAAGTGVYLGDEAGKPLYTLRFLESEPAKQLLLKELVIYDNRTESSDKLESKPAPLVSFPAHVRLVIAGSRLKAYVGGDGEHWGQIYDPLPLSHDKPIRTVGVYAIKGLDLSAIQLAKLSVRSFPALDQLAAVDLVGQAPAIVARDYGDWLEQALGQQPDEVATEPWLRACALRTLGAGIGGNHARQLVLRLLADGLADADSLAAKWAFSEDLAAASDNWISGDIGVGWPTLEPYLDGLAREALASADPRPYTRLGEFGAALPFWTGDGQRLTPTRAAHDELVANATREDWRSVAALTRTLKTRPDETLRTVVAWAEVAASPHVPALAEHMAQSDVRYRHPVEIDISREGFNRLAEIDAALAGGAEREACELITALPSWESFGWLLAGDADRWTSLPQAIEERFAANPRLAEIMQQDFLDRAELRLRQAIDRGEVAAVERIPLQFHATATAAAAQLWLGKRYLSSGDLLRAVGYFRAFRTGAADQRDADVVTHELLARAMFGDFRVDDQGPVASDVVTWPELPESAVRLADRDVSPGDFMTMLRDFSKLAREPLGDENVAASAEPDRFPQPAEFDVQRRARLDQTLGANPGNRPGAYAAKPIDWVARQLGVATSGNWLVAHNRFGITGYDLTSGQRRWHENLGDNKAETHAWPLAPFQPTIVGQRVFARRLLQAGPGLACIALNDGKPVWKVEAGENRFFVSDPVIAGQLVLVLRAEISPRNAAVHLAALDRDSGEALWDRPLLDFDKSFVDHPSCTLVRHEDTLLATLPGVVACCRLDGSPLWARRQAWFPPNVSLNWTDQFLQPPRIADGKAYVVQPGTPSLQCLEAATGRVLWRRLMPHVGRILGVRGDKLIVEESEWLVAIDAGSGELLWQHKLDAPLEMRLLDDEQIIYARRESDLRSNRKTPQFVWLDLETGQPQASALVDLLAHDEPFVGPAILHGEKFWVFSGVGSGDPARDFTELIAKAPAAQLSARFDTSSNWFDDAPVPLRDAAAQVLKDWKLLSGLYVNKAAVLGPQPGSSRPSVALEATDAAPLRLARRIALPAGTKPKLILGAIRHGHAPQKLEVLVDGQSIWKSDESQNVDQPHRVDLSAFAGQQVWIVVRQWQSPGGNPEVYWDRLEIAL